MISIIMPSLNPDVEKITNTLKSIFLNSTEFEVILVLQQTSVKKIQFLKNFFSTEKNLKIIEDEQIGISAARNKGIKISIGSWILLLDDDIYIKPDTIEYLTNNLTENSLMYYGNAKIAESEEYYVKHFIKDKDISFWSYNRICSITLVIHRSVFDRIGYFDETLGSGSYFGSSEESDLVLRALLKKIKIKYIKDYNIYHEKAFHSLSKVESYARGGGALYKKFIYCKNPKLYLKFILDLILRVILLLTFKKKRYIFLKGFFAGLTKFKIKQ